MNQKMQWRIFVFIVFFFLVFPLLSEGAAQKPSSMSELALYQGSDRQEILVEGAKKEGTLTFYTSGILKQAVNPVVAAFQKTYPFIKVEIWRASSGPLISRAVEEFKSGKHLLDVMEGTQTNMLVLQQVGIVASYYSPNFQFMDEEALTKGPGGGAYAAAFRSSGIGFGYNTKMVMKDQLPKTYEDLTDPKWKGKLAVAGSDTGVNWMSVIHRKMGMDLLKKIAAQGFQVHMVSGQAMLDMIINGEYPASPTIFDSHVYGSQKRGAPVAWVPLEPVRVNVGQLAVAKNAPHPHAALLFADFETSRQSAEIHRGVGYDNFRKDVQSFAQKYKKYFGEDSVAAIKEDHDLFSKLFVKK